MTTDPGEPSENETASVSQRPPPPPPPPAGTTLNDVVVLDTLPKEEEQVPDNLQEDYWLSTVDGRFESLPIPIRVGLPGFTQTFYVHQDVLNRSAWFRKALQGNFKEASSHVIELPEEDPSVFHHLVAYLYEGRYVPVKNAASEIAFETDKGKGVEESASDSDSSTSSWASRSSVRSRQQQEQRRRRREVQQAEQARLREKHPGQHRFDCQCVRCEQPEGPRCWDCGAWPSDRPRNPNRRRGYFEPTAPNQWRREPEKLDEFAGRIKGQDLTTWLIAYELNIDVYICAERYLMDDFKSAIMEHTVDMLETAGTDAAQVQVLRLCGRLHENVPETDHLLKMVLSRVGFLQPLLWKFSPAETSAFLVEHPEVAALMLRETAARHNQGDTGKKGLPPMELEEISRKRSRERQERQRRRNATMW